MSDPVNNPAHYTHGKFEPIDVAEDWKLGYHLSTVLKYLNRAEHKGKRLEDLKKAQWFLNRYVQGVEDGRF
jgi:hypothetical protein